MNTNNKKKRLMQLLAFTLVFSSVYFSSTAQIVMPKDEAGKSHIWT